MNRFMKPAFAASARALEKKGFTKPKPKKEYPTHHITKMLQIWGPMTRDELYKITAHLTPNALPNTSHIYQKKLCQALIRKELITVTKFKIQKGEPGAIAPRQKDVGKIAFNLMKKPSKTRHGYIDPTPWMFSINPAKLSTTKFLLSPERVESERKKVLEHYQNTLAELSPTAENQETKQKFYALKSLGRLVRRFDYRAIGGVKPPKKDKRDKKDKKNDVQTNTASATEPSETDKQPTEEKSENNEAQSQPEPTEPTTEEKKPESTAV